MRARPQAGVSEFDSDRLLRHLGPEWRFGDGRRTFHNGVEDAGAVLVIGSGLASDFRRYQGVMRALDAFRDPRDGRRFRVVVSPLPGCAGSPKVPYVMQHMVAERLHDIGAIANGLPVSFVLISGGVDPGVMTAAAAVASGRMRVGGLMLVGGVLPKPGEETRDLATTLEAAGYGLPVLSDLEVDSLAEHVTRELFKFGEATMSSGASAYHFLRSRLLGDDVRPGSVSKDFLRIVKFFGGDVRYAFSAAHFCKTSDSTAGMRALGAHGIPMTVMRGMLDPVSTPDCFRQQMGCITEGAGGDERLTAIQVAASTHQLFHLWGPRVRLLTRMYLMHQLDIGDAMPGMHVVPRDAADRLVGEFKGRVRDLAAHPDAARSYFEQPDFGYPPGWQVHEPLLARAAGGARSGFEMARGLVARPAVSS